MVNPISSAHASYANQVSQAVERRPQPQSKTTADATLPQDTVSLKSTGNVDHDSDSH